jgi:hypothetical protein
MQLLRKQVFGLQAPVADARLESVLQKLIECSAIGLDPIGPKFAAPDFARLRPAILES